MPVASMMPLALRRRALVAAALVLLLGSHCGFAQSGVIAAEWAKYRDRFVTADGRVIDTGNKAISHTEGQGWAMLFAEASDDRASFAKIWGWTRSKLQRRDNALFSWRWDPADGKTPVTDRNDASDGDIAIAWALIRAARRWHMPEYAKEARPIVADIRRRLLVTTPGRLVLLPGLTGFKNKQGDTVVNPSYYVYPAFRDFARLLPSPEWRRLRVDGLELLADARFGRWGLTPDWVDIPHHGDVEISDKFPPRFGFEAIRVPLYLIWSGWATPERLASYLDFWNDYGNKPIPAWVDLKDNSVAPYAGSIGFQAVIQLTRDFGNPHPAPLPTLADKDDYYAASLTLLAIIARTESAR
jgi:endoglucanase